MDVYELRAIFQQVRDEYLRLQPAPPGLRAWIDERIEVAASRAADRPDRIPNAAAARAVAQDFFSSVFEDPSRRSLNAIDWPWPFGDG